MADRKKTILAIVGAAFLILIIFAIVGIAGFAYFVRTHVSEARDVPDRSAVEEIARTRERFAGQTPLIERRKPSDDDDDERFVIHRPEPGAQPKRVEALRVLAYNPRDERMLRVNIPFWLLRLAPRHGFNVLEGTDADIGRTRLTIDDLERHGPGLVLDATDHRGSRVLVWLE